MKVKVFIKTLAAFLLSAAVAVPASCGNNGVPASDNSGETAGISSFTEEEASLSVSEDPVESEEPAFEDVFYEDAPDGNEVRFSSPMPMSLSPVTYDYPVVYNPSWFRRSSFGFSRGVAELAFAAAWAGLSGSRTQKFFSNSPFTDARFKVLASENVFDSISYSLARIEEEDFHLVAITVRGYAYDEEWIGNFNVGAEGFHRGFGAAAEAIFRDTEGYISGLSDKPVKILLNGYSRGGGVANVLGCIFNDGDLIPAENVFVYTFEAPRGVPVERKSADANIRNVIVGEDIVTMLVPEKLGLKRAGIDTDVFTPSYAALVKEIFPSAEPYAFVSERHENAKSLFSSVFGGILQGPDKKYVTMHDRESYEKNFTVNGVSVIGYFINLAFNSGKAVTSAIKNGIYGEDGSSAVILLGSVYGDPSALYETLKPILDGVGYETGEDFEAYCNALQQIIRTVYYSGEYSPVQDVTDAISNIGYIATMHSPETSYALLKNL